MASYSQIHVNCYGFLGFGIAFVVCCFPEGILISGLVGIRYSWPLFGVSFELE